MSRARRLLVGALAMLCAGALLVACGKPASKMSKLSFEKSVRDHLAPSAGLEPGEISVQAPAVFALPGTGLTLTEAKVPSQQGRIYRYFVAGGAAWPAGPGSLQRAVAQAGLEGHLDKLDDGGWRTLVTFALDAPVVESPSDVPEQLRVTTSPVRPVQVERTSDGVAVTVDHLTRKPMEAPTGVTRSVVRVSSQGSVQVDSTSLTSR